MVRRLLLPVIAALLVLIAGRLVRPDIGRDGDADAEGHRAGRHVRVAG